MLRKIRNNKGFTLVEMLVILMVMGILAGITIPSIKKSQYNNAVKNDTQMVELYEKAIEAYTTMDYSSVIIYKNNGYIGTNTGKLVGGKATYSDIAQLTDSEIIALNKSGQGVYPKTKAEVTASIKMYGDLEIEHPKQSGYAFFFNTINKTVEVHEIGYAVAGYICIDM